MNPSKNKGTAAETAVVKACQRLGFPDARRQALAGAKDQGDIELCPGVILEVKSRDAWPSSSQIQKWLHETEREWENSGADLAALVVKRPGVGLGRAEEWLVFLRWTWLGVLSWHEVLVKDAGPVSMDLATFLRIIRILGFVSDGVAVS